MCRSRARRYARGFSCQVIGDTGECILQMGEFRATCFSCQVIGDTGECLDSFIF